MGFRSLRMAAEGFGSRYDWTYVGYVWKYGVLSFNGNKMITTSGGGALICPDGEAKREIMFYATQARELIRITSMSGSGIIIGCRIFVRVSGVVR